MEREAKKRRRLHPKVRAEVSSRVSAPSHHWKKGNLADLKKAVEGHRR